MRWALDWQSRVAAERKGGGGDEGGHDDGGMGDGCEAGFGERSYACSGPARRGMSGKRERNRAYKSGEYMVVIITDHA